jgi:hypothetical protein
MSKFLLNLLLQISKALVNSKIQFLIQKSFFLAFSPANLAAHSASGPASPPAVPSPQAKTVPAGPSGPCVGRVFAGICFPFRITPSRVGRLSLISLSTRPHLSDSHPSPRRPTPVGDPLRRCPAPRMPPSFYSPPSSLSPLKPLQTEP